MEGLGPHECRRVVVRVRDDDGGDAAEFFDVLHSRIVDVGNAVPQDVALVRAEEEGALADGELWLRGDADDARVVLVLAEDIGILLGQLHLTESRPSLAVAVGTPGKPLPDRETQ